MHLYMYVYIFQLIYHSYLMPYSIHIRYFSKEDCILTTFCVKNIWIINKSIALTWFWKGCIDWNLRNATFLFITSSCVSCYWRYWTLHTNGIWTLPKVINISIIISASNTSMPAKIFFQAILIKTFC